VTCWIYTNTDDSSNIWIAFVSESGGTVTVSNNQLLQIYIDGYDNWVVADFGYDDHNAVYLAILKNTYNNECSGLAFTYDGSAVTIGTKTIVEDTDLSQDTDNHGMCWDTTNNVFHLTMNTTNTTNKYIILNISVTSARVITHSANTTIASAAAITQAYYPMCTWDATNDKVFCGVQPSNAGEHFDFYPVAFNGSTYTVGTKGSISTYLAYLTQAIYDPNTGQILVAWALGGAWDTKMNVVDLSDDSVGTEVNISSTYNGPVYPEGDWDYTDNSWLAYHNQSLFITDSASGFILRGGGNYGCYALTGTVGAGKTINLGTENPFYNVNMVSTSNYRGQANAWDASSNKLIVGISPSSGAASVAAITPASGGTNVQKWLGFAESTVGTGVSVDITHVGGINASQTGLTAGATYYATQAGALTATAPTLTLTNKWRKVGPAISATSLLVAGAGDSTQAWSD